MVAIRNVNNVKPNFLFTYLPEATWLHLNTHVTTVIRENILMPKFLYDCEIVNNATMKLRLFLVYAINSYYIIVAYEHIGVVTIELVSTHSQFNEGFLRSNRRGRLNCIPTDCIGGDKLKKPQQLIMSVHSAAHNAILACCPMREARSTVTSFNYVVQRLVGHRKTQCCLYTNSVLWPISACSHQLKLALDPSPFIDGSL
jgi:hypothetical protein